MGTPWQPVGVCRADSGSRETLLGAFRAVPPRAAQAALRAGEQGDRLIEVPRRNVAYRAELPVFGIG